MTAVTGDGILIPWIGPTTVMHEHNVNVASDYTAARVTAKHFENELRSPGLSCCAALCPTAAILGEIGHYAFDISPLELR